MKKRQFLFSFALFASMILSSCGEPAHQHAFGDAYEYDEVNHWHTCECGEKDAEVPHDWDEGTVTTPATCEEDGVKTFTCVCGATKTEVITKLGHEAGDEWQNDATSHWKNCIHDGCYEELEKADHTWDNGTQTKPASCTEKGNMKYVCTVCGYEKNEEIPMADHSWDAGVVTTEPGCETTGVRTYTCSECSTTRTETIDALDHDWENKNSGEAYQYNANGSWEECSVCHTHRNDVVNAKAPWAAFDFVKEGNVVIEHSDPTSYDLETHTFTTSNYSFDDGVRFVIGDIVDSTRKLIEVTLTVDGQTSWGAQASFFFADAQNNRLGSVFCLKTNPLQDSYKHQTQFDTTVFENGQQVTALSAQGVEFTYRFDFRGYEVAPRAFIINGANGQANTPDIVTVKSIVAKETICGHSASYLEAGESTNSTCTVAGYTQYSCNHEDCGNVEYKKYKPLAEHVEKVVQGAEKPYQYDWAGTAKVCEVCGAMLDDSQVVKAPWLKLDNPSMEGSSLVKNSDGSYTAAAGGWDNKLLYTIPNDLEGRTLLTLTFTTVSTYDLYLYVGNEPNTQYVTASAKINWSGNKLLTDVLGPDGASLGYNPETSSISSAVGTNKTTLVWDLSKAENKIEGQTFKVIFYAAGTHTASVDLRTPCNHEHTEAFSTALSYGTRCSDCGAITESMFSTSMAYGNSAYTDKFTLTDNVTYDGKNCAKLSTNDNLNTSDAGYAQNYKLKFNGLVSKMRSAGKTKFSFDFNLQQDDHNFNIRFYWGVGNNKDYAWADHYNQIAAMGGTTSFIASSTTLTKLSDSSDTKTIYPNTWYKMTVDLSNTAFANYDDYFFIGGAINTDSGEAPKYPVNLYFTNINIA